MDNLDLSGRTALVTGSARGLGREIALGLASAGASVAIHYHTSDEAAKRVAQKANKIGAAETTTVSADVTDWDAVEAAFDIVETELGSVDILINNVGSFAPKHWLEISIDEWQSVMETNVHGTYLCTRRALPNMRSTGWGRIVSIGYAGADRALVHPKNAPYFIAKTGVAMFTRMVAADTRDENITANVVAPYVLENSETFPDDLPKDRPATFDEVIEAVLFFVSPQTEYISGQHLAVDGGWLPERV